MSKQETSGTTVQPLTVPAIQARKGGEPLVALTAYTARMAELLDPYCDILLVGDSLGMVLYGLPSTLGVSLRMMIDHGAAVVRGARRALVVIDMPFGSYEESPAQAFRNAAQVLAETGAQAVKLEGGRRMAETISFLVARGVPVLGHVGLTPQAVHALGGYGARGRRRDQWQALIDDAVAVAEAGAFAIVIEGVVEPLARRMSEAVPVPTIGIGASAACDGQILVTEDMLGLFARTPRFVRRYAELSAEIGDAVRRYAEDVRNRRFPGEREIYRPKTDRG